MNQLTSIFIFSVLLAIPSFIFHRAVAGPYTDDLSKCLVSKTTANDKKILIYWMFSSIALNPEVSKMANISSTQRTKINSDLANLFETLITKRCKSEAKLAFKYEGSESFGQSFEVLGKIAGREIFANPKVSEGIEKAFSLIDKRKFESVFNSPK
jgi:hypothetical protein